MLGADRVVTHVVGGVGISVSGDCPPGPIAESAEPPAIVLRLEARRVDGPVRPSGTPAFEPDSWAAFLDGETLQLCAKHAAHSPPETMRIDLAREGLEGTLMYARPW